MGLLREYVVFDTETTGSPPGGRLVEIGALKVRGGNVVDHYSSLIFPECPIPAAVIAIHGITDAAVAEAPTAAEVLPAFLEWAGGLPLVGHNVSFDARVVAVECLRTGLPLPANPMLCTLRAARRILSAPSYALTALVEGLGLPTGRHHRALEDSEHAFHLLQRLRAASGADFDERSLGRGRVLADYAPAPPRLGGRFRVLEEAAAQQEAVDLRYRLTDRRVMSSRVSPRFFYRRRGKGLVMEGFCHYAGFYKSYRMERILAARLCPGEGPPRVRRPAGKSPPGHFPG